VDGTQTVSLTATPLDSEIGGPLSAGEVAATVQVTDNVWEFMAGPVNSSGHPAGTAGGTPFGGWFDSEGRRVRIKWMAGHPDDVHYSRLNATIYAIVQVNNCFKGPRPKGTGVRWVAYDAPQVVVQFYDGYTGKLLYAEGISTTDAKPRPPVLR
jgi:hypothetical protein